MNRLNQATKYRLGNENANHTDYLLTTNVLDE